MTKEDWNKLYDILHSLYYEFLINYNEFKTSNNSKTREASIEKVHNIIQKSFDKLSTDEESFRLIFGDRDTNVIAKQLIIEDFKKPQYFERDMEKILERIYFRK